MSNLVNVFSNSGQHAAGGRRGFKALAYCVVAGLTLAMTAGSPALAARPTAPKLLPPGTVAYVRIHDVHDLSQKFLDTALGRMSQDPQLAPLVKQLYGSAAGAWLTLQKQVDTPLDDLLAIPQGEIAIALVTPAEGPPALVALIDVGDHAPAAQKLLDRGSEILEERRATKTEETVDGTKLTIFELGGRRVQQVTYALRDGTVLITTNRDVAKTLLGRWGGVKGESFANNSSFAAVMNSTRGSRDGDAQITWFVDPIATFKGYAQGNVAAQFGLAILPTLGLDGLKGIGGSITLGSGEFDMITQSHLLLENPRAGVVELIALEHADTTPESWVPDDVASYLTVNWDLKKTYTKATALFDSFQSQGAGSRWIKDNLSERIGVDFETEIMPSLDGRFTYLTWIERPVTITSQAGLLAAKLKDPKDFEKTLEKLVTKFGDRLEKRSFGGTTIYNVKMPEAREGDRGPRVHPCFAIISGYVMAADRPSFLEKIAVASTSNAKPLADALDYKLIASKVNRQSGDHKPGLVSFSRPEEGMRMWYELATGDKTRDQFRQQAERNQLFKALNQALDDHPLPPFEVIEKYLAPGGAMLINDETGLHYTTFTLRRN